jgi:hypothetical protein
MTMLNEVNKWVEGDLVRSPKGEVGVVKRLVGSRTYVKFADGAEIGFDMDDLSAQRADDDLEENIITKIDKFLAKKKVC